MAADDGLEEDNEMSRHFKKWFKKDKKKHKKNYYNTVNYYYQEPSYGRLYYSATHNYGDDTKN